MDGKEGSEGKKSLRYFVGQTNELNLNELMDSTNGLSKDNSKSDEIVKNWKSNDRTQEKAFLEQSICR